MQHNLFFFIPYSLFIQEISSISENQINNNTTANLSSGFAIGALTTSVPSYTNGSAGKIATSHNAL